MQFTLTLDTLPANIPAGELATVLEAILRDSFTAPDVADGITVSDMAVNPEILAAG